MNITVTEYQSFVADMQGTASRHGCVFRQVGTVNEHRACFEIAEPGYEDFHRTIFWVNYNNFIEAACVIWADYFANRRPKQKKYEDFFNALRPAFAPEHVYCMADVHATQTMYEKLNRRGPYLPKIKDVIFHDPATIVFWEDGVKTVVKVQEGDVFDPEKGLAMAISKRVLGNKYDYYHTIKHWTKKYVPKEKSNLGWAEAFKNAAETLRNLAEK